MTHESFIAMYLNSTGMYFYLYFEFNLLSIFLLQAFGDNKVIMCY